MYVSRSSALLNHCTTRGGVKFFLDKSEASTQFQCASKRRREAGAHEKQVAQAGPDGGVLLEH